MSARPARPPRLHHAGPLVLGETVALAAPAARHVQVLRLQPGDPVRLFDGTEREVRARVERIERRAVAVRVEAVEAALPEPPLKAWLAVVVPANDRMDTLVEKATELGMAGLQPLWSQRSVVRLDGARAVQRREHWQGVAIAASEQCGRCRVPEIRAPRELAAWLADAGALPPHRLLLWPGAATSAADAARPLARPVAAPLQPAADAGAPGGPPTGEAGAPDRSPGADPSAGWGPVTTVVALSGPEGGLTEAERNAALARGFAEVSLGPRVLRADTAPLAWLAHLMLTLAGNVR